MYRLLQHRYAACLLLSALALSGLMGSVDCGDSNTWGCQYPDLKHHDKDGNLDPCHCDDDFNVGQREPDACYWYDTGTPEDAGADGPIEGGTTLTDAAADAPADSGPEPVDAAPDGAPWACTGQCWPSPPAGWTAPLLLAIGNESGAPPCPDAAPVIAYEGVGDLDAPPASCGGCSCGPPAGSCVLPAAITAGSAACSAVSTFHVSFDPPPGWGGACSANEAIPGGALCGGAPCVQSVTIAPLTLKESGCAPMGPATMKVADLVWNAFARACTGPNGLCASPGESCGPAEAPGFLTCVLHPGEVECPSYSPYSERHVFYQGADDTRGCSACACGAPLGSTCEASLSISSDHACSAPVLSVAIDAVEPRCVEVEAGTALGSEAITAPVYAAGSCQPSGGEASGAVTTHAPVTFCCLPMP